MIIPHFSPVVSCIMYTRGMAITPKCDKCGEELVEFGAILFSPPDEESTVKKFHICKSCYKEIVSDLESDVIELNSQSS